MKHLNHDELSAHLDGALAAPAAAEADRHLAECETCRNALAALAAQDESLRPVLEHDPGDAYFDTFAARVEDRIRAAGLRGAQARARDGEWLSWLRSPRRLATVGALAAVIGGAAIVIVTARMERPQPSVLLDRPSATQTAPAPADDRAKLGASAPEEGPSAAAPPGVQGDASNRAMAERREAATTPQSKDALATQEAVSPEAQAQRQSLSSRAQAAPQRTDLGATSPGSTSGFSQPPSAPSDADAKRVATRKAEPARETRVLARDEAAAPKALALDGASQLCGQILNAQGTPVRNAVVALSALGLTATTDENGRFCFQAPAGTHEVTVLAVGYQQSRLQANAGPGAEVTVRLQPVPVLESPMAGNLSLYKQSGTDPFARAPARLREAVAAAREQAAKAQASGSAKEWDAAAVRWERIVPRVSGAALQEARFREAEARVHAWDAGRNATRMRAANDALVEFLRYAPAGPQRDQAATWLARLLR